MLEFEAKIGIGLCEFIYDQIMFDLWLNNTGKICANARRGNITRNKNLGFVNVFFRTIARRATHIIVNDS